MTIRRTPAAPKFKKPKKDPSENPDMKFCAEDTCRKLHKGGQPGTYVMATLLDPRLYWCGEKCYLRWAESHRPRRAFGVNSRKR